jgi:hypothetical protein
MEPNKAAGPDGFNAEFYQKNWELVKSDIKSMFDKFYAGKLDITRFNYGVVTLIPKGKDADCIHKYRPVCLLNVILKNFTKVLVSRLVKIIWKVIKLSQTAFLKGIYILEGVVLMHEILNEMHTKNILKLFSKFILKKLLINLIGLSFYKFLR